MVQYLRIADQLRDSLMKGPIRDGQPLSPELELCEQFGVSRTTIRAALRALENEGLIRRERGRGTFLRAPGIAKDLGSVVDFHTEAREAGRVPYTQVLSLTRRTATLQERALFGLQAISGGVAELHRLRALDGEPAVLQRSYLAAASLAGIEAADLHDASLYRVLEERRGLAVTDIEETLEPCAAPAEAAMLLNIAEGTALFRSQRVARGADGAVIEISDNLIRGDLYRFHVQRKARRGWS